MDISNLRGAVDCISAAMANNKNYLIELDQRNGDGDLGISMSEGYNAIFSWLDTTAETDLGKALMKCSSIFNESAPSTLGTITSIFLLGMAKVLKGKTVASLPELIAAMEAGLAMVMDKTKAKQGEKTILDSICPAVKALAEHVAEGSKVAFLHAAEAAALGSENTRMMKSVHGRAAYYGDKSIGLVDGGAVAGKILFESLNEYVAWEPGIK